ncbi:MAG: hypothetical protein LUD07_08315 [Clostridiales bacterium]|nr:hypothetical protein [Clostridiales bacterium]
MTLRILSGIREMVDSLSDQNVGTISIPVYLGNSLLDEIIVDAQQRQNLRSGGLGEVCSGVYTVFDF